MLHTHTGFRSCIAVSARGPPFFHTLARRDCVHGSDGSGFLKDADGRTRVSVLCSCLVILYFRQVAKQHFELMPFDLRRSNILEPPTTCVSAGRDMSFTDLR